MPFIKPLLVTTIALASLSAIAYATVNRGEASNSALPLAAQSGDLPDLRVEYRRWSIGADGARQELTYTEHLIRDRDQLWIEREIPEAARVHHDGHAHGGLGHKHDDVVGAPLWVRRDAQGVLDVELIDREEQRLIRTEEPNYGNVGFVGRWDESYHLLNPADLGKLTPVGDARDGVQRYEIQRGTTTIRVSWDIAGHYAREITSEDSRGLSGRTIRASVLNTPAQLPWTLVAGYAQRDYSDLLD